MSKRFGVLTFQWCQLQDQNKRHANAAADDIPIRLDED